MTRSLPIKLSAATGVPYYRQIRDQITALVSAGALKPGEQLPSGRELATQLVVSLITVRRAYADLELAGLVQQRQGQGSFIADELDDVLLEQGSLQAREALNAAVRRARAAGVSKAQILTDVRSALTRTQDGDES